MNKLNKSKLIASLTELNTNETKLTSGGFRWGGPITLAIYEIIDVITSNGENLRTAYENGRKAAGDE